MKREEIKNQISECLIECTCIIGADLEQLTDLFIELSDSRCDEQVRICFDLQTSGLSSLEASFPRID